MKHIYFSITALFLYASGIAQCTTPVITQTSGPATFFCNSGSATITATAVSDEMFWFNAATGGNVVASGASFTTPTLTANTTFWAEAWNVALGTPVSGQGKTAPTSAGGTAVVQASNPWGLQFTATQSFMLNSVDVFLSSTTAGTITMELKDANWNLIQTISVAAPAGGSSAAPVQFTVPLNLVIDPGSYKLVVLAGSPAMIRDLGTNAFPYMLGTLGSVTGGTINNANTNSGVYYFLYNWNITPMTICKSTRVAVNIDVLNVGAPTGASSQTFAAGETLAALDVTGESLTWYADAAGTTMLSASTPLVNDATYWVSQTVGGCTGPKLAITVTAELGVPQNTLEQLRVYPNPAVNSITVSAPKPISKIEVFSLLGQQIMSKAFNATEVSMDIAGFTAGSYIAKVHSDSGSAIVKFVKQ